MWDNFRIFLSSTYFDLKEDKDIEKKQVGYLAEEIKKSVNSTENHHQANVSDAYNNWSNVATDNAKIVQQMTAANKHLTEKLNVALDKNKVLNFLLQQKLCSDDNTKNAEGPPNGPCQRCAKIMRKRTGTQ